MKKILYILVGSFIGKVSSMNPALIKFAVELQNGEKIEKKEETIKFKNNGGKRFFNLLKLAKVTVPIEK